MVFMEIAQAVVEVKRAPRGTNPVIEIPGSCLVSPIQLGSKAKVFIEKLEHKTRLIYEFQSE
jgi:hypothetical protein